MTREEIIKNLEYTMEKHKNDTVYTFGTNISVMCKDIIDYLVEQEPCEDCVSREAVINAITANCIWENEYNLTSSRIKKAVENLPPVTPKQRWIPVDYDRYPETYPKAFQEVWITDAYGEVRHKAYDGTRSIKAWMPYIIPEPYKAESEG